MPSGADVIAAAEAQSKMLNKRRFGLFRPKLPLDYDPFWEFMRKEAHELEDYPYSGYLLLDLELLASGALGTQDEVGAKLSEITKSSFGSFRPADAARAIAILDKADFSEEAIKTFLDEEGRADEYPETVLPTQDSVKRVKSWLGAVTDGNTGILNIG